MKFVFARKLQPLEHDNPVTAIIHHGIVELPATGNVLTKRVGFDTVSLRAVLAQAHRHPFKPRQSGKGRVVE